MPYNWASLLPVVNWANLRVVVLVAFGVLSNAYGLAIIGPTAGQWNFYIYFNLATLDEEGYEHTTKILGALNGANSAGALMGCAISAWAADKYGRKRTMQLGCAILILGGVLNATSVNITMLAIGRAVAGVGAGILAIVVPIYQAEVSAAKNRGAMMCVTGIMYALGYAFAGWIGYACAYIPADSPYASAAWRFPLAFQCLPPLIVLCGSRFIPFSPRWLLSQDRPREARDVIMRLHARNGESGKEALEEYDLMQPQHEADKRLLQHRTFEIFRTKANRHRALVSALLMIFNQFLGVYVLANYGVLIYTSLGLEGNVPLLLNACWTTLTIVLNTLCAFFVDRFGRKRFLLIGTVGCCVALIFEAALTAAYYDTKNDAGLAAAVFFVWFYLIFWSTFMDATQFVYVSEIWPNHLRSQGTAWGLAWFFLSSEVTLVAAPVALNNIGWKFYLVLICPSIVYIFVIYWLFPETKQLTLEEIGKQFGDKHIVAQWSGIGEEEMQEITQNAIELTIDGQVPDDIGVILPENGLQAKERSRNDSDSSRKTAYDVTRQMA
ncbi:hypothetical protein LTR37_008815 [Vermiconidia calcicola]|uniref:Uncharacterized protein n=1 Tax=Vermiconidia calcicola TaxID=1690605 RepID=A0ACC3NA93_9PEZI|nr:hypothetical protein LTR37_008815 [Vermiconidia calcicola]